MFKKITSMWNDILVVAEVSDDFTIDEVIDVKTQNRKDEEGENIKTST